MHNVFLGLFRNHGLNVFGIKKSKKNNDHGETNDEIEDRLDPTPEDDEILESQTVVQRYEVDPCCLYH